MMSLCKKCRQIINDLTIDIFHNFRDNLKILTRIVNCKSGDEPCRSNENVVNILISIADRIIETDKLELMTMLYDEYNLFWSIPWLVVNVKSISLEMLEYLSPKNDRGHCIDFSNGLIYNRRYDALLWLRDHGSMRNLLCYPTIDKEMFIWWLNNHMPIRNKIMFFEYMVDACGFFDSLKILDEFGLQKPDDHDLLLILISYCSFDELREWHETLYKPQSTKIKFRLIRFCSNEMIRFCIDNFDVSIPHFIFQSIDDLDLFRYMLEYAIRKAHTHVNDCWKVFNSNQERDEQVLNMFCELFDTVPNWTYVLGQMIKYNQNQTTWWLSMRRKYAITISDAI